MFKNFFRTDKCCPIEFYKLNLKLKERRENDKLDLKYSSITADILNVLTDGKVHTMQEIADQVEVSQRTVRRHIQSLSYRFPIQTFKGGIQKGGVYIEKEFIYQGRIRTKEEIEIIKEALVLMKEREEEKDKKCLIENLINEFTL